MVPRPTFPSTGAVDLEGVEDLFHAWIDAVTVGDSIRIARLHLPAGIFQLARAGTARGHDSIRRYCAHWLSPEECRGSFALLETRLFDTADIATGSGRFTLTYTAGSNGKHGSRDSGRLLLVAEKDRQRWRLRFSGLFSDAYLEELATVQM